MNFRKVNNLTGWAVFIFAFATYFLTREARGSLWDCGEFVATAKNVGLPHPPGAPLFVLLGRFFIILFGDNDMTAANAANFMSALASAATILFLFWNITHFARKMFVKAPAVLSSDQLFTTMSAGVIGALAYAFSDSFWFSAVEGEVYALSSFFTALVFWAILKWEHADEHAGADALEKARSDRWIVFLFFMMGLSIGVHLLNLLTIPAIVMVYYYRRYTITLKGAIVAFIVGCIITGLVQVAVIQYSMKAAGQFDVYFNENGMPPFAGFAIYFLLLAGLIFWALRFTEKNMSRTKLIIWFTLFLTLSLLPFITAPVFGSSAADSLIEKKDQYWTVPRGSILQNILKFLLVAGIATLCAYFMKARSLKIFKLSLWAYAFIMIGYFMYFTALIRSNANPAIDMNNVDNPISLVYYLSREQYGEAPLVYGPHFLADVKRSPNASGYNLPVVKEGEMRYVKNKGKYIAIGRQREYLYDGSSKQIFPRVWDSSNDQYHFETYIDWLQLETITASEPSMVTSVDRELGVVQTQNQQGKTESYNVDPAKYSIKVQRGQTLYPRDRIAIKIPTYRDNFEWFMSYQMSFMYWRYFMWNFAGKQNDIQASNNRRDGNWLTGYSFMDNKRLGDQAKMPDSIKNNKAHNTLFLLPFVLGIVGCVYQFLRRKSDWVVTFLLFFFTGIAVVLYLNQPGNQPRERDYAYVGSFYAFAIWIGLAVVAFVRLAREQAEKLTLQNTLLYGGILTFVIMAMSTINEGTFSATLMTAIYGTAIYLAIAAAIIFLTRAVSSGGKNGRVANIVVSVAALLTPLLMAQQEWNDHNRSQKTLAPDLAKNYLESCAPNAIIFTFGDNDTYPLWYAQEVEGVRPDIRIINNSLLGIDWYINQLRYKINNADSVDVIWSAEQVEGHNREVMYYQPEERIPQDVYYPLYDAMKNFIGRKLISQETGRDVGAETFPVKRFKIPVDANVVRANGTINATDSAVSEIRFEISRSVLQRNDLMIMNIIAANNWKRPIYFTSPYGELGFGEYLRKDGLAYRLVPVAAKSPQQNWLISSALREVGLGGTQIRDNNLDSIYGNLLTSYEFGGANKKGIYFDEENRRHLLNIRSIFGEAAGNLADAGRKEDAIRLLDKIEKGIDPENFPYAMVSRYSSHNQTGVLYLEAAYKAGKTDLAEKVRLAIRKDLQQQREYYVALNNGNPINLTIAGQDDNTPNVRGLITEYQINEALIAVMDRIEAKYAPQLQPKSPAVEGPNGNPVRIETVPVGGDTNNRDTQR